MASVFTHRTLREEVALFLRNKILNGEIKPGEKINEVELSKELNISRGPVREAPRQIEQEGLVDYMPNKGCTVKIMAPDDMSEAYLIMMTLETLAVRVFNGVMRSDTLERLNRWVSPTRTAT